MLVLIVSDARLYREGLAALLLAAEGVEHVETTHESQAAVRLASSALPWVILLDMAMPDGFETLRAISGVSTVAKVVSLGVVESDDQIIACAESGAVAYLSREGSLDQLVRTMQSVARGETLCSPHVAATLFRRVATLAAQRDLDRSDLRLSPREREVAVLLEHGLSNKEIAQRLTIEIPTVKNHIHNLLEKLQVRRRGEAAAKLRRLVARESGSPWSHTLTT